MIDRKRPMLKRPDVKLKMRFNDKMIEFFGGLLLLTYWGLILYFQQLINGKVVTHFNLDGVPDSYGGKETLTTLPTYATVLYGVLTLASFFPRYLNYLDEITPENAAFQYRRAATTLKLWKFLVVGVFLLLSTLSIANSEDYRNSAFNQIIALSPYTFMIPSFYYLFTKKSSLPKKVALRSHYVFFSSFSSLCSSQFCMIRLIERSVNKRSIGIRKTTASPNRSRYRAPTARKPNEVRPKTSPR